jgi:hypothetical protein
MEAIILDVPLETAKNWLEVPKFKRKKMAISFQEQIDMEAKKIRNQKLFKAMNEIALEAKRNGLTPEILEEILNSNEQEFCI